MPSSLFRRQVAVPQDHGSWVFILSPLVIGLFAEKRIPPASLLLVLAALAAFLIRQPVTVSVKAYSGRRPRTDLPAARFWMIIYGVIILLALAGLITEGYYYILLLAVPGMPVFAWHLWLVSRREERRQAGVEILATGVLALAAPAAIWVAAGHYDPQGWWLWLLTWLQSAASIVYAYLRLEQRSWRIVPVRTERFRRARRSLTYSSFNVLLTLGLGPGLGIIPAWIFVPFLVQWLEVLWGSEHPAVGWKPTKVGVRQLVVSTIWTLLFLAFWRL